MELRTDSVFLYPITERDTEMVLRWRNSQFIKQHFIHRKEITAAEHQAWLDQKVKTGKVVQFIICLSESNKPVGSVYIQNVDMLHKNAEYGIFIGEKEATGKGCGTDAAKLMIKYAFEVLGLHKLYLRVLSNNERAINSYKRAGFEVEGILRDEVFVDGRFADVTRMSIIAEVRE